MFNAPLYAVFAKSKRIPLAELHIGCAAIQAYANTRFCPLWGLPSIAVRCFDAEEKVPSIAIKCALTDTRAQADALAWHSEEDGRPVVVDKISVILDNGGSIFGTKDQPLSVMGALSHEIFECAVNAACNRWVMMPDGRFLALEVCDPVQGIAVPVLAQRTNIYLSDVVGPAYFDPQARPGSAFDALGRVGAPFAQMAEGWWDVYDPAKGEMTQAFGAKVPGFLRKLQEDTGGSRTRKIRRSVPLAPRSNATEARVRELEERCSSLAALLETERAGREPEAR